MKGKSLRRRQRNFTEAKSGNLLKAQFGKASKWDALPAPPTAEAFKQPVSRRTREVADFMAGKRKRPDAQTSGPQPKRSKNKFKSHNSTDEQAEQEGGGRSESSAAAGVQAGLGKPDSIGPAALQAALQPLKGHKKKTRQKQVLDEKKRLKKLRKQVASMGGAEPKPRVRDSQRSSDEALKSEAVAFGEVAHAPPKATLKQRHWDSAQAQGARASRHAQLMQRQMRTAQSHGKAGGQSGSSKDAATEADARAQAWHRAQVQRQVQDAYRQEVKGQSAERANLRSLKALVAGSA